MAVVAKSRLGHRAGPFDALAVTPAMRGRFAVFGVVEVWAFQVLGRPEPGTVPAL
jgi:hypothetical protein